jgi:hypothetical protein
MIEEWNVLEDIQSKLLDSTRVHQIFILGAVEVEEEPVSKLDLKEQSNEIGFFPFRLRES